MKCKPLLVLLLPLFSFSAVFSQKNTIRASIYFETAKYDLNKQSTTTLNNLVDSIKGFEAYKIYLNGNTDNIGDTAYNQKLSENRINAVVHFFRDQKVSGNIFTEHPFGETKPVAENATETGRQKNRRVDIAIVVLSRKNKIALSVPDDHKRIEDSLNALPDISELYEKLKTKPDEFCINNQRDTFLRCSQGTIVMVKALSFNVPVSCKNKCITVKIKEEFLKSDMILDRVSTMSGLAILESQAMIHTEAVDCNGNSLELKSGKDLVIMVPTDTILPDATMFNGHRQGADSDVNWTPDEASKLSNFNPVTLGQCSRWLGCGNPDCKREHFFFDRIGRLPLWIAGSFDNSIHLSNLSYRDCQRVLRQREKINRQYLRKVKCAARLGLKPPPKPGLPYVKPRLNDTLKRKCKALEDLYKKYGVHDMDALMNIIYKPLIDLYGVKNYQEYLAAKETERIKAVEEKEKKFAVDFNNKKIPFDKLQYYVYNTPKLGWSNIDRKMYIPWDKRVSMRVKITPAKNTDCKLVFKSTRSIVPAAKEGISNYIFKVLPKGEFAWVVIIRYQDGKAFLGIQSTMIEAKTLKPEVLKEMTYEELKEALMELDRP